MNNQPPKKKKIINDIFPMLIGEILVAALVCFGFGVLHLLELYSFNLSIVWGAILGAAAILINYVILILSVDLQIQKFMESRGNKDMSEEELADFAKKGAAPIQNAIKISMFVRTGSLLLILVIAFITGWFNPFAAAIPMLAFRPLLTVIDAFMKKHDKDPDPSKFIKYDFDDENDEINEEKEDN